MARTTRPLTNTEVLRAKALEKDLTLHDGDGLFLIVKTSGKKLWRFRYQRPATKQGTMMGLGAFPALSLADARGLRADYLALLANGIDPQIQAEVAEEQQQIALDSIFSTVAANWFQLKSKSVIWKCCRRLMGCLWAMPALSRVITVNISITRIWPIWRPTDTGRAQPENVRAGAAHDAERVRPEL